MPIPRVQDQQQSLVSEQQVLDQLEQIHILDFDDDDDDDDDNQSMTDEQTRLHSSYNNDSDDDSELHLYHHNDDNNSSSIDDPYPQGITPIIPTAGQPTVATSNPPSSRSSYPSSPGRLGIPPAWRSGMLSLYHRLTPLIRAAPGYHLLQESTLNARGGGSSSSGGGSTATPSSSLSTTATQPLSATSSTTSPSSPPAASTPVSVPLASSSSSSSADPSSSIGPGTGPSTPRPIASRRIGNYGRQAHDGVFANLSAKPQVEPPKPNDADQVLPSYESAIQDVTPPYYQMAVVAPGVFGDEILVDGMPVGNVFQFIWNVVVSSSFQFVGVLLTFLLHNTHASKSGSLVGLGMTLLNFGYHIGREESDESYEDADTGYMEPSMGDGGGDNSAGDDGEGSWFPFFGDAQQNQSGQGDESWVALLLMLLGWMVIVKALADYARAKRTEMIIQARPESERMESQADREMAMYS